MSEIVSDIIGEIKGWIRSLVTSQPIEDARFIVFFEGGLKFSRSDAEKMAWCYLGAVRILKNPPGLGYDAAAGSDMEASRMEQCKTALINAQIGIVKKDAQGSSIDLRLSNYLRLYKTPNSAAQALSPAKRDALAAEARKLAAPELWPRGTFRSQYSSSLRG